MRAILTYIITDPQSGTDWLGGVCEVALKGKLSLIFRESPA